MAIIVDKDTKLVVQGLTGSEGSFHGLRNKRYGTQVVAGVTPGKGGQDVEGIPVFNTVADAVAETGANTTMVFVPARFAADAIYEAVDAGIATVICIAEGLPAHEMLRIYTYIRPKGVTMLGPNCPGALSPGKANVGIIPAEIFTEGNIGLVSRSGTLTYQIGHELTQMGLGNSTIVGIGGDPIVGSSFIDVLEKFESDPQTEYVVMVGEIGGDEEEKAAAFIEAHMTKPVVAYIAGFTAPPGKTMGHAGAIISGSSGTAQGKKEALEAKGIRVGTSPTEAAEIVAEIARLDLPAGFELALLRRRLAEREAERRELRARDLAVELVREAVQARLEAAAGEQVRGERLHREGEVHDLDRVPVAAGDVRLAALREHVGAAAAAEVVLGHAGPHLLAGAEAVDRDLALVVAAVRDQDAVLEVAQARRRGTQSIAPVAEMRTSASGSASSSEATRWPSMCASSAATGSISTTVTRPPAPRAARASPLPTQP